MKKIFSALTLLILFASSAFALSDSDYLKMKRNNVEFARADRKLTNTWNKLKKSLPADAFKELQKDQREWIRSGRDDAANVYIKQGSSRTEAYTLATYQRANILPQIAKEIEERLNEADADDNYGEIEEDRFKISDSESVKRYTGTDEEKEGLKIEKFVVIDLVFVLLVFFIIIPFFFSFFFSSFFSSYYSKR